MLPSNPQDPPTTTNPSEKMDNNDVSLIGKHCQYEYCNQLDFLPFICPSCKHTFCQDHFNEEKHKCEHAGDWGKGRREAELAKHYAGEGKRMRDFVSEKPCHAPNCKTRIGTSLNQGVHCDRCNYDYCLKHRFREEHDCDKIEHVGARPGGTDLAEQTRSAFAKLRAWGTAKKVQATRALPKAKPTTASARLVAVNDLKKTAKGDAKLGPEKRVYLYVEAEAETTTAKTYKGRFFYSKDWVIGRALDMAAKELQIENVNNSSSDEKDKLRVFHVEGGRVLEFNEKVGSALVSGNTIVLLRGIGPPPDLIEL
ncbi:AN1-like zinc finger protein [Xylariaceae sp. FL0255]|nr:AN1-like zinc finger protein [Xylariaceae sp. FL0255]